MPHSRQTMWQLPGVIAAAMLVLSSAAGAQERVASLEDAQQLFYNARYVESVEKAASIVPADEDMALTVDEVRASALLFEIKRLLAPQRKTSTKELLKRCIPCPDLLKAFAEVNSRGQAAARARLAQHPGDETALFFVGKFDLNYVWLQLGPLGRKTGWNEYWEARKSLDTLLKQRPDHVRGRTARAWMEYVVDTKLPWGTEWIMGGGDRRKALTWAREAAGSDADRFTRAEAEFALWEMLVHERRVPEAMDVATRLAANFPENKDVAKFVDAKGVAPADR